MQRSRARLAAAYEPNFPRESSIVSGLAAVTWEYLLDVLGNRAATCLEHADCLTGLCFSSRLKANQSP